jgi:hypothetical protein
VQQVVAEHASQAGKLSVGRLEFVLVDIDDNQPFVVEGGLASIAEHRVEYV